jgi:ATP-binding cassette subfamily B protein
MKSYLLLKDFFKANWWRYGIGVLWLMLVNAMQLIVPGILGSITDGIRDQTIATADLWIYVLYILVIALVIGVSRFLWRVFIIGTARKLEYFLRNMLFGHLLTLSAGFYNKKKTGDLMAHATNDINAVRMAAGPGIIMITDSLFLTVATIFLMVRTVDLRLTLLALLPLPFMVSMVLFFGKVIHKRFKAVQESFSGLTDRVQENLSGIRVVKSFVQEEAEITRFNRAAQNYVDQNMNLIKLWGLFFPMVQFISAFSYLIVLGSGGIMVINGVITLGDFIAFNSYLGLLIWPMMALGWVVNVLQRGAASMERIKDLLEQKAEVADGHETKEVSVLQGGIQFKDLTFAYPDGTVALKNIDITVKPGQTLAVVGRTGSGKSTLANLLLRIYNPEPGSLALDGVDINQLPLKTLRESIGYVPQETFLFSTSIRNNIAFADIQIPREEVEEAARTAQVYDNIMDFPHQFETISGERGVTLSGGQKQRVSIARALIKNPKILILDDCLSAVDTHTEEEILKGLKKYMDKRTSIIISHRISTVKDADEIVVLDSGCIVERGSHHQLLRRGGVYQQMWYKQQLERKIAEGQGGI